MFIYAGKQFNASSAECTIVGVRCEKCGCEYYYELARIGWGVADAPYGIGVGHAASAAHKRSMRELQNRLASEAELVPCPKCNWVNEELVHGYRRSRYRGFARTATFIGIAVIALSGVLAWFFYQGDPRDRYLASYFLYGSPVVVVAFMAAMFGLRGWLRSLIQPNRKYPGPPAIPAGTPPALFGNPDKGEFWLARLEQIEGEWQEFQIGRNVFPLNCCDCLRPATTEYAIKINLDQTISLDIPLCNDCSKKPKTNPSRIWAIIGTILALIAGMTFTFQYAPSWASAWINLGILLVFFGVVAMIATTMKLPSPVEVQVIDLSRGVVRIRFRNSDYARLFAEQDKGRAPRSPRSAGTDTSTSSAIQPRP